MSRERAHLLLAFFIAGLWLALLPAVALADTCKERADAITAGLKRPNEPDPDCKRAGVIAAGVTVAAGAAAAGMTGVRAGLGGGPEAPGDAPPKDARPDDPPPIAEARRRRQKCWDEAREYRLGSDRVGPGIKTLQRRLDKAKRVQDQVGHYQRGIPRSDGTG